MWITTPTSTGVNVRGTSMHAYGLLKLTALTARVHMVEGRADDRSKKSSRCEYVIRNRPRHTATDRRRSDSARALSSPFLALVPNLFIAFASQNKNGQQIHLWYQTFNENFSFKISSGENDKISAN